MKDNHSMKPFSNSKNGKILGFTKQDIIKYFFGGNAAMAIIIIVGIITFLVVEATTFFPDYKKSLTLYRQSGQELVDFSAKQHKRVLELESLTTKARSYEIQDRLGALYRVTSVHAEFKAKTLKQLVDERKELKRAENSLESTKSKTDATPEQIQAAEAVLASSQKALKDEVSRIVYGLDYSDISDKSWITDKQYLEGIRNSVVENIITGKTTQFVKDTQAEEARQTAEVDAMPFIQELKKSNAAFGKPLPAFYTYIDGLRDIASVNKAQGEKFSKSAATIAAMTKAKELARTDAEKQAKQIQIDRQLTVAPDFTTLCEPLYESKETHKEHHEALKLAVTNGYAALPAASEFESKLARGFVSDIKDNEEEVVEFLAQKRELIERWKHDETFGMGKTIGGFFFGTEWITNSSWQDFYGIVPLLTGSVFVALVAICIAIPFSVGGAIYVNRLATKAEQNWIKPFIEFIQAIPSIVLAFFGYVVLGALIQKYSQDWMFSWLPGFPVEGKYTILNAGLLLALMAVPTIFTLCEDALNNVPKAYKEASLALGATRLQTVTKVILPSCASGIIAAVLLGFGRIVGETMVVLLVLGGRISIPTSWSDPAHSMTGILAQEIGEVDKGSLHWGALFMVALVLFIIALGINYISQRVLSKYTR